MVARIGDGRAGDVQAPRRGINQGIGPELARLQAHGHRDGFDGGARLKHIGDGTVAQLLAREFFAVARVKTGVVGQGQQLPRARIHHHHRAAQGFVGQHLFFDFLVGKKLDFAVDGQGNFAPINRRDFFAHAFHHPPQAVFDHPARARLASQLFFKGQLHALLAFVLHIGKANNVGRRFALRVLALVFARLVDAFDGQRLDLLAHIPIELALEPDKGFVRVQLLLELRQGHIHQLGQRGQLGQHGRIGHIHVFRDGPDAGRWHAGGQNQPVAIQNAPPVGRQLNRAGKAHLALAQEKVIANQLHIGRASGQAQKAQGHQHHHQAAAPQLGFVRQQGAAAIRNAAHAYCPTPRSSRT